MAAHLAEQVARRHEEYLKAEVSSLRSKLTEAEETLRGVNLRLSMLENVVRNLGRGPA